MKATVSTFPRVWPQALETALAQSQLPGLDAVRAFAVLLVVFYHHGYPLPGGLGVLAFFVLSGFLITWLLLREQHESGGISIRRFYWRRALRIFPAFYVYWILIVGGTLAAGKPLAVGQAAASLIYGTNYYHAFTGHQSTALSHTWSLGVEEQFYLLWPLGLRALLRRGLNPAPWLLGAIGAVWVWRAAGSLWLGLPDAWIYEAFDTRADHLLVGCMLAVALHQRLVPGLFRALCSHPALPLLTMALVAAGETLEPIGIERVLNFMVQPLLIAALLVQWMAVAGTAASWRWLNWGPLVYLGRISYSTYLYQQPVSALFPFAASLGVPALAVSFPAIIGLASLSYWVVERPFLHLKDRLAHTGALRKPGPGLRPAA